jgi:hypothetical protein
MTAALAHKFRRSSVRRLFFVYAERIAVEACPFLRKLVCATANVMALIRS